MGAEEAAAASGGSSLPMMIAVAVVAITVVLFLVFRKKAPTPDAALLLGLQDSGKTAVYTRLRYGDEIPLKDTVTSIDVNEGPLTDESTSKSVTVVDVPGNSRQMGALLPGLAGRAGCVVFVIDAKDFSGQSKENAARILDIFSNSAFSRRKMLVACNKSESPLASSLAFVRKRLEKDIELLLTTRRKDITNTANDDSGTISIDSSIPEGEAFTFDLLASGSAGWQVRRIVGFVNPLTLMSCSVGGHEPNLQCPDTARGVHRSNS